MYVGNVDKTTLIKVIARETGSSQREVATLLKSLTDIIKKTISKEKIIISGFGTFTTRTRRARPGRNPKTGDSIQLPKMKAIGFVASRRFKNAVRGVKTK